jgi:hypothetical protein
LLLLALSFDSSPPSPRCEAPLGTAPISTGTLTYTPDTHGIIGVWLIPKNSHAPTHIANLAIHPRQNGSELEYQARTTASTLTQSTLVGSFATDSSAPVSVNWSISFLPPAPADLKIEVMSFLESDRRGWRIALPLLLRTASALFACTALVATYATIFPRTRPRQEAESTG